MKFVIVSGGVTPELTENMNAYGVEYVLDKQIKSADVKRFMSQYIGLEVD